MITDVLDQYDYQRLGDKFTVDDGCWEWTGFKHPKGYGVFSIRSKNYRAHRIVYEIFKGEIPEGMQLDHLCRNRGCVRPDHLEPVTNEENFVRGLGPHHQAMKTHCPQGHEYTEDNIYYYNGNYRMCRACTLIRRAKNYTPEKRRATYLRTGK